MDTLLTYPLHYFYKNNMIASSHYKALLKLGLPIVIGQLGMIVLGFADTLMIGHHSTEGLAAASFVNNMFNLVIIFATGFSYGLTPIVGSLFGSGEQQAVGRTLKNALWANGLMGILLTALMMLLYANIHRLGQPEELLPLMRPYYLVLLASLIPVLIFNAFKQFADGITDTQTPMWLLIGGNTLNILGNWMLIYGHLGFPEMGLLGAGIATLSSRIIILLAFIGIFLVSKRYHTYRAGFLQGKLNKPTAYLVTEQEQRNGYHDSHEQNQMKTGTGRMAYAFGVMLSVEIAHTHGHGCCHTIIHHVAQLSDSHHHLVSCQSHSSQPTYHNGGEAERGGFHAHLQGDWPTELVEL